MNEDGSGSNSDGIRNSADGESFPDLQTKGDYMSLYGLLSERQENDNPIRVGVIGAGKFSSMFLSQVLQSTGIQVVGIADLKVENIFSACKHVGWPEDNIKVVGTTGEINDAAKQHKVAAVDDALKLIAADCEVILEITGNPIAGSLHAEQAIKSHKHVVMVSVEADSMIGPVLSDMAKKEGVQFSMAYGDQPALILEMIDWARTIGFEVVCAGKGTRFQPEFHYSTPDTIWGYYGFSEEMVKSGDYNAKMFNSFLDGTKSAIEMTAVANGSGLSAPEDGLGFPPISFYHLQDVLKPADRGGILPKAGMVECIASEDRYKAPIDDNIRFGVYLTLRAPTPYVKRCFGEYGVKVDSTGEYASLYRPYHFIGLELNVSVASVALRNESTGSSRFFNADVATKAKKDLAPGEIIDGEGGYTVYGSATTADNSLKKGLIPLGLSHGAKVIRPVKKDALVTYEDVEIDMTSTAYRLRKELETRAAGGEFRIK
jgi:predicted homoserine dehydrogenase-like protein